MEQVRAVRIAYRPANQLDKWGCIYILQEDLPKLISTAQFLLDGDMGDVLEIDRSALAEKREQNALENASVFNKVLSNA